ncbi:MAG: tRNA dihydrouridine synthase DusB [Hyphomicrobiaceae bacterium]
MSAKIPLPRIRLGAHIIHCPVLLAPMSGVTDLPFRRLASRLGAHYVVSEMIASRELIRGRREIMRRALGSELSPFVIQLAGTEPHWMAEAAQLCTDLGADIIDINMGCPAKAVTGMQSGSALMRDLPRAVRLIQAVIAQTHVPVTLKMRLGWDRATMSAPILARMAQEAGISMIVVHGRTRNEFFKGSADWTAVSSVVDAVTVPVIVNGDILDYGDLMTAILASGASGVMVGRGAYGRPWLPAQLSRQWQGNCSTDSLALSELTDIALDHLDAMLSHYGADQGLRNARKHISWYIANATTDAGLLKEWRRQLCTEDSPKRVVKGLKEFFGQIAQVHA